MVKPSTSAGRGRRGGAIQVCLVGLGVMSGSVYLLNFRLQAFMPGFMTAGGIHIFLSLFLLLALIYLTAVILIIKYRTRLAAARGLIFFFILAAVMFRIFLLPAAPAALSKDMYRYIWDARVQAHGINPYLYPPSAPELAGLREARIYPNINRRDYPTIYPAGAQIFFRTFYALAGDSVYGFKALMIFFDALTLLALLGLLGACGVARSRVLIYAWNPLVIFEIAYSGHLEGLTVFLIVTAFFLHARGRKIPATAVLALAGATKLYPCLLLPALLNRGERIRGIGVFTAVFALCYLPFLTAGSRVTGFLPIYLHNPYESFNLGLKYLLMDLFPALGYFHITLVFSLVLALAGFRVLLRDKPGVQAVRQAYILTVLLILLMPTALHPWYVIALVPFLAFYPQPAWILFSCAVVLSYLKYLSPSGAMPVWVLLAEYLPLFALLAAGGLLKGPVGQNRFARLGAGRNPGRRPAMHPPPAAGSPPLPASEMQARIAVVIPALNEADAIGDVVRAIPRRRVCDVIVVDNGSTDATADQAIAAGARVIREPRRGYGAACLAGARAARKADVIVFLDGDRSDDPAQLDAIADPVIGNRADLVIGSRIGGALEKGAMPLHGRLGNRLVVVLLRLLYRVRITDIGSYRAITPAALFDLDMEQMTFGWPVEMVVKAARRGLRITSVPIRYRRRIGVSKVTGTLKGTLLASWYMFLVPLRYLFKAQDDENPAND